MGNLNPDLRIAIQTIYERADAAVNKAGPRCEASGRCCRFAEYGHTLFLSQIEAEYLLESAPSFTEVNSATCPFQVERLCTAREPRPLGCRVYFCEPNYQEEGQRISEQGIRELKALADEQGLPWRYAPLHVFLQEHLERIKAHTLEEHSEQAKEQVDSTSQNSLAPKKPHKISLPLTS